MSNNYPRTLTMDEGWEIVRQVLSLLQAHELTTDQARSVLQRAEESIGDFSRLNVWNRPNKS